MATSWITLIENVACIAAIVTVVWVPAKYRPWESPYDEGEEEK